METRLISITRFESVSCGSAMRGTNVLSAQALSSSQRRPSRDDIVRAPATSAAPTVHTSSNGAWVAVSQYVNANGLCVDDCAVVLAAPAIVRDGPEMYSERVVELSVDHQPRTTAQPDFEHSGTR